MIISLALMAVAALFAADRAFRNPAAFTVFVLAAGVFRFGANVGEFFVSNIDLSAVWLLTLILLSCIALIHSGAFRLRLSSPELWYLCFLGWCAFEAVRSDSLSFALRMLLKLIFPLLVMLLARATIVTSRQAIDVLRAITLVALIAFLLIGGVTQRFVPAVTWTVEPMFWVAAAFADYAALMCVLSLTCWRLFGERRYLVLAVLLGASSLFVSNRTGILATAAGVSVFCVCEFRVKAVPLLIVLYTSTLLAFFALPSVRDRMFLRGQEIDARELLLRPDRLPLENIDSSGRFTMWGVVLKNFFWPSPVLGSGLGSTQQWFYGGNYGAIRVEHSEYVRLLSDTGLVGLGLYLLSIASAMLSVGRIFRSSQTRLVYYLGMFTFCSFPAYAVCMALDNVLNYTLCSAQYPFAFTGITLGLHASLETRALKLSQTTHLPRQPAPAV